METRCKWTEEENNRFEKLYKQYKNECNLKEILRQEFSK